MPCCWVPIIHQRYFCLIVNCLCTGRWLHLGYQHTGEKLGIPTLTKPVWWKFHRTMTHHEVYTNTNPSQKICMFVSYSSLYQLLSKSWSLWLPNQGTHMNIWYFHLYRHLKFPTLRSSASRPLAINTSVVYIWSDPGSFLKSNGLSIDVGKQFPLPSTNWISISLSNRYPSHILYTKSQGILLLPLLWNSWSQTYSSTSGL